MHSLFMGIISRSPREQSLFIGRINRSLRKQSLFIGRISRSPREQSLFTNEGGGQTKPFSLQRLSNLMMCYNVRVTPRFGETIIINNNNNNNVISLATKSV